MTKAEIVNSISNATGLTKVETEAVVNGFISTLKEAMMNGENVEIRGFGTFKIKKKKARIARNPRTSEKVEVPERFVPIFKPSRDLKNAVDKHIKSKK